ncbi:MAG: ATPase P [Flavobacteriales bacterium CG18_big_fil_WC_8_21_14_2_50_32_9]|nr:MAG: ATPase P [Flavobacteriales bacterium CG18_big_fil_WC_8_21_14_2_50_32_9]
MKKLMLLSGAVLLVYLSSQVCGCGSCSTANAQTSTVNQPISETKTVKLKITGMTCAGCSNHVTQTLEEVKGVVKVELQYPGDVATIEYDAEKTSTKELIAAIEKINYKAIEIKPTKN